MSLSTVCDIVPSPLSFGILSMLQMGHHWLWAGSGAEVLVGMLQHIFYHILHPQKHILRGKVCWSVIFRSWGMEYPIFSFSHLFCGGYFENGSEEGVHPKNSLLTLQILIL